MLLAALRSHDVVIAQQLPAQLLRYVEKLPIRYVADLYNPLVIELLEALADAGAPREQSLRAAPDPHGLRPVRGGRLRDLRQREAARPVARRPGAGRA